MAQYYYRRERRWEGLALNICRYLLSALFLFSGFVKAIDPMGGGIKIGEYAASVGLSLPEQVFIVCSILLSSLEFALGLSLLMNVGRRMVRGVVMLLMILFTLLTLAIAVWNPVPDCGCFGDAVKLSNWQTFYKNLIFLPLSILLFAVNRPKIYRDIRVDIMMMLIAITIPVWLSVHSLRHLPLIDFMPFKVGVNIPEAMEVGGEPITTLIYFDRELGENMTFTLEDTTWYDDVRYEFVETQIENLGRAEITDFALYRGDENISSEVLSMPSVILVVSAMKGPLDESCLARVSHLLFEARESDFESYFVCSEDINNPKMTIGSEMLDILYIDDITRKMLLRSDFGVVLLDKGTIIAKWSCHDIPNEFTRQLNSR